MKEINSKPKLIDRIGNSIQKIAVTIAITWLYITSSDNSDSYRYISVQLILVILIAAIIVNCVSILEYRITRTNKTIEFYDDTIILKEHQSDSVYTDSYRCQDPTLTIKVSDIDHITYNHQYYLIMKDRRSIILYLSRYSVNQIYHQLLKYDSLEVPEPDFYYRNWYKIIFQILALLPLITACYAIISWLIL